ncbi:MAG: hypothetical protein P8Z35_15165 [Ignavibacteriaceae bacterium]
MRRPFVLEKKTLNKPSRTFTVGSDNCDFTSLVDALENGVEGDMFIVYGGIHDGKLNLRKDQSIHCIGKVILKQSANDFLFYLRQPSDYDAGNPGLYEVNWSGSLPYVQFYSNSKWISLENNFLATIDMSGFYLHHLINFSQQNTDAPTILSVNSNLIVSTSWYNPLYIDTGSYDITIFSNSSSLIPPISRQYYKITSSFRNRIICSERITDDYKLDINSLDLSGNAVNACAGFLECRIPFYFENL